MKKVIAMFMVLTMIFGNVTAFGAQKENSISSSYENEDEKIVYYIGDIKLVAWENEDEIVIEQYDEDDNLVERAVGNRNSDIIEVTDGIDTYEMDANDVISVTDVSYEPARASGSFSKVATVKAFDLITGARKTMYLYEKMGSGKNTTYTVNRYNGKVASFVLALVKYLFITEYIGFKIIDSIIDAGLGVITGESISITSSITLSCKAYPYSYYGKDSGGEKSDTYSNCGYKYVINDEFHKAFYNKSYFDGLVYDEISSNIDRKLELAIVNNLYGVDYDVD